MELRKYQIQNALECTEILNKYGFLFFILFFLLYLH
jgi:hypothetical protein